MTELQRKYGPWAKPAPLVAGIEYVMICTLSDRLPKIAESEDVEWLKAVAADRDGGRTERMAAERRLRLLAKRRAE